MCAALSPFLKAQGPTKISRQLQWANFPPPPTSKFPTSPLSVRDIQFGKGHLLHKHMLHIKPVEWPTAQSKWISQISTKLLTNSSYIRPQLHFSMIPKPTTYQATTNYLRPQFKTNFQGSPIYTTTNQGQRGGRVGAHGSSNHKSP